MTQTLCKINKFGYCKFGDKCRNRHNNIACSDNKCKVFNCEKRHPKICKFMREFGRCKFTTGCAFDHKKVNAIADKIDENATKIKKLELKLAGLGRSSQDTPDHELAKSVEIKIEAFQCKIETLQKALHEKDSQISALELRVEEIEKKSKEEKKSTGKKVKDLENVLKISQQKRNETVKDDDQEIFECEKCDFKTTSKSGLKTHTKRKHTEITQDKFPRKCDMCELTFENAKELKRHMKTHSYQELRYKCEDCAFWGPNSISMEVHHGKMHCQNYECGMCEYPAKDSESLEIHIQTCEIYKCESCDNNVRCKTISEIKTHAEETHKGGIEIFHVKQDRKNDDYVSYVEYWSRDLFKSNC